jgi:cysteine desulfurase/selenocysteine lyase
MLQSAGHMPVDVQAIGCDFWFPATRFVADRLGVFYGRKDALNAMPPWQGGGEMILTVDYHKTTYKQAPHKFEAGTPDISGPIGLHAAMDYLDGIGRENIWRHDQELAQHAYDELSRFKGVRLFGPNWPRWPGQLPPRRCPRARRGDGGRPARCRAARRASL